jgi:glutaredoxin 2
MKIFGDANSGNCLKVKWICDRLRIPYRWIDIDTMKGETRTPEFLRLNSAGQVPTIELDDGRTLAQSNAIIRYLARQRFHSFGCLCCRQDGRVAVLGAVQPRTLYRRVPLPDGLSQQAGL